MKLLDAFLRRHRRLPRAVDTATISDTIDRALSAAGLGARAGGPGVASLDPDAPHVRRDKRSTGVGAVGRVASPPRMASAARGVSTRHTFGNASGSRDYTLHVPESGTAKTSSPRPLLIMLHGCTQSSQEFAAGTGMDALADTHGWLVAYPEQAARHNGSRCWNWFRPEDQVRGAGEPSILAGIVGDIAGMQSVDRSRVYVAGLSAGGAMAVILGRKYPEVFAAVGAHSALPFGVARDVPGAFAAMQSSALDRHDATTPAAPVRATPTIVFHGQADRTVHPANGRAVLREALGGGDVAARLRATRSTGLVPGGRAYTVDAYVDSDGGTAAELWSITGAGHAWSGGADGVAHTDPGGPDASAEMVRFFLGHRNIRHAT